MSRVLASPPLSLAYLALADPYQGRRRKTRCIFPSGQDICKECNYHGRRCVDQTQALLSGEADIVDKRPNLRVRVARLEFMLERLVQDDSRGAAKETCTRGDPTSSDRKSMQDSLLRDEVGTTHTNAHSPLSSLFDNEMVGEILFSTF